MDTCKLNEKQIVAFNKLFLLLKDKKYHTIDITVYPIEQSCSEMSYISVQINFKIGKRKSLTFDVSIFNNLILSHYFYHTYDKNIYGIEKFFKGYHKQYEIKEVL